MLMPFKFEKHRTKLESEKFKCAWNEAHFCEVARARLALRLNGISEREFKIQTVRIWLTAAAAQTTHTHS